MAMDAKALLDSLMGPSRDKPKAQKKTDEWKARDVCKRFLVGFCPNNHNENWFHNTKRDVGVCKKVHSEALKNDFLNHPDRDKYQEDYEMEFLKYLEQLNAEADAWIARERGNCAGQGKAMKMTTEHKNQLDKMQRDVDALLKEAEDKAENNDVTGSKQSAEMAKQKQEEITNFKQTHSYMPKGDQVCEVCGIRNNMDDVQAVESHRNSNLHSAYLRTRAKAKELREKLRNRSTRTREEVENGVEKLEKKNEEKGKGERRERSRSRDRRRDRDKSREKDRRDDRDRQKRRSRSRERRRR